jgi:hypothetical protein
MEREKGERERSGESERECERECERERSGESERENEERERKERRERESNLEERGLVPAQRLHGLAVLRECLSRDKCQKELHANTPTYTTWTHWLWDRTSPTRPSSHAPAARVCSLTLSLINTLTLSHSPRMLVVHTWLSGRRSPTRPS